MATLQNLPLIKKNITVEKGATYWLTGLSGCGKSTLAEAMKAHLDEATGNSKRVTCLDGDVIRQGLNAGLGFTAKDREENVRRIGEVSKLLNASGQIVFCSFISPEAGPRATARETHESAGQSFTEVYVCPTQEICEKRDPKGLYKKARAGIIPNFTGVSAPYDEPKDALRIDTGELNLDQCMRILQADMLKKEIIKDNNTERPVAQSHVKEMTKAQFVAIEKKEVHMLEIDQMQAEFVQTIGEGWANPLTRFMSEMELTECLHKKTLTVDGVPHLMSCPITQHCTKEVVDACKDKDMLALIYNGETVAIINKPVFYANRKEEIATRTFGCFETSHPYTARIVEQGDFLVSGESMDFVKKIMWNDGMDQYRMTPQEISDKAKAMNADAVFAFQVRNPLHNGHCLMLQKTRENLLEQGYKNPVLLLHPLGGWCKDDDVPLGPRMKQHQALIDDGTLPKDGIILAVWPSPMFYGGPTEVLWHCSSRVGAGITHFITGRDPAGVGHPTKAGVPLYDVLHGGKLLKHCQPYLQGVEVLPFLVCALNTTSHKMEFFNPKAENKWLFVSGSEMRRLGKAGEEAPEGFMSEAGWQVLKDYYQGKECIPAAAPVEAKHPIKNTTTIIAPKTHAPLVEEKKTAPIISQKTSVPIDSKSNANSAPHSVAEEKAQAARAEQRGAEAKAAKELHDKAEAKKASDAKAVEEAKKASDAKAVEEAKANKLAEETKPKTEDPKPQAEESSTNWAVIGLAAAAVAGGVWYYMKNVKK